MKSDEPWIASNGNSDQVDSAPAIGRALSYLESVIGILFGPALMVTLWFADASNGSH